MGTDYHPAYEARELAVEIIKHSHPHLVDAIDLIAFYYREGNAVDWAGKCKKTTSFERFLLGKMFIILIDEEAWDELLPDQKLALVDHELCHIRREYEMEYDYDKKTDVKKWLDSADPDNWGILEHDVEEFADVIKRHGLWDHSREQFGVVVKAAEHQLTLADILRGEERAKLGHIDGLANEVIETLRRIK